MKCLRAIYRAKGKNPEYTAILKDGGIMCLGENPFKVPTDMIYKGSCELLGVTIEEYIEKANKSKSLGVRIHPNLLPDKIKRFLKTIMLVND